MSSDKPIVLTAEDLVKSYNGTEVIHQVSFEIKSGEVLGLVGENGAGKSTMVGMFSGSVVPDSGTIHVNGDKYHSLNPMKARENGIGAVRQEPVLVPTQSIAENVLIGREPQKFGFVNRRRAREITLQWLAKVSSSLSPDSLVESLLPADRQFVEFARVIGANPRVVFLDEPTAVLGPSETEQLFKVIRNLTELGTAVVYVSHRLEEIFAICNRVVVLRDGNLVADKQIQELDEDSLVSLIAGRELASDLGSTTDTSSGGYKKFPRVLYLKGAHTGGDLHSIDLEIREGEIHGIFGIVGSGRTRLARMIAGIEPVDEMSMELAGDPYTPKSPREAIEKGVVLVPEDRHKNALFQEMTLSSNVLIGSYKKHALAGFIWAEKEERVSLPLLKRLDVRPLIPNRLARTLSGGNQQKLILARGLDKKPILMVLDEPTRGVDVGAKVDIHEFIRELASQGIAVLAISSDLRELLAIADRITVMARGRVVDTFEGFFDKEEIIAAATSARVTEQEY